MKALTIAASGKSRDMNTRFHCLICATLLLVGGWNADGDDKVATNAVMQAVATNNPAQTNRTLQQPGEKNEDRAAALLRDYRGDLVFVKGQAGVGSGFIPQIG